MAAFLDRALEAAERAARKLRARLRGPAGFADLEMHLWMLSDETRSEAYERAIAGAVREGDVVVDVGAGTGLLSMMACRAGASKVYAIEETEIAGLARRIIEANGLSGRIVLVRGRSSRVELPERADVVVSETIGSFVFSEGILQTLHDARGRFLKEGGTLIPRRVRILATPVESWREGIGFWERPVRGFDYAAARDHVALGTPIPARKLAPEDHLSDPGLLYDLDFSVPESELDFRRTLRFVARRDGVLHGFLGTWEAELHDGVVLRCDPQGPPVHWPALHFRLPRGMPLRAGDGIVLRFARRDPPAWRWSWEAEVERTRPGG